MIFEFLPHIEYIGITAQYSNAVLLAILPHVSDFAKVLSLPMPTPVLPAHVERFSPSNHRGEIGGSMMLTSGAAFSFTRGHVDSFYSPHSYFRLQDPDMVPKFYAPVRLNQQGAIQLARDTLKKLGYSLESVFAEFEPMVKPLERVGTNVIPHYWIEWPSPTGGQSVMFEIDGNRKVVEQIQFHSPNLYRPPPKIDVEPATLSKGEAGWWTTQPLINPEYGYRLLPIVMKAVDDYGKALGLPVPRPLSTNHVERFKCEDNGGWPHAELFLTNGWRFVYRNSMVNGYYAPNNLLNDRFKRPFLAKDLLGKWNLTEAQAIERVHRAVAKLNYPSNLVHMDFPPRVSKPPVPGIPRYAFSWDFTLEAYGALLSRVEAEVNAETGELTSFYHDDKAYWNKPPPIDVPISARPAATSKAPLQISTNPVTNLHPSQPPKYVKMPR